MNIRLKSDRSLCSLVFLLASLSAHGQGTFIYDQQSATESTGGGGLYAIQSNQPIGQSFIPNLTSVEFIRLYTDDNALNGIGATVYVNLRSGSITGPILGSSDSVFLPDGFTKYTNFFFSTPVTVIPGTTYFFQPVLQSGDSSWTVIGYNAYNYTDGTGYLNGAPVSGFDLWFREGIVPEPSSTALVIIGAAVFILSGRFRRSARPESTLGIYP